MIGYCCCWWLNWFGGVMRCLVWWWFGLVKFLFVICVLLVELVGGSFVKLCVYELYFLYFVVLFWFVVGGVVFVVVCVLGIGLC